MGIILLDEFSKEGVFNPKSKRYKQFITGKDPGVPEITKRRLKALR